MYRMDAFASEPAMLEDDELGTVAQRSACPSSVVNFTVEDVNGMQSESHLGSEDEQHEVSPAAVEMERAYSVDDMSKPGRDDVEVGAHEAFATDTPMLEEEGLSQCSSSNIAVSGTAPSKIGRVMCLLSLVG